jgi:hypothetical protein
VLVNDVDRTELSRTSTPNAITRRGSRRKLGLHAGENTMELVRHPRGNAVSIAGAPLWKEASCECES